MKIETPQILWNAEVDSGKNAPLYSVDILESGIVDRSTNPPTYGNVMVSAGNCDTINLWNITFNRDSHSYKQQQQQQDRQTQTQTQSTIFQKQRKSMHKIDYMMSLTRHEMAVNTVSFSPNGLHLATAGEAGAIIIWSVPVQFRGNGNGRHYWSNVKQETDLKVRIVSTRCEGITGISWSSDSKRFMLGTIDSNVLIVEDKSFATNQSASDGGKVDSEWKLVYRNEVDHTQFVQGVAYDPLGIYMASMGSDRTVRVYSRKLQPKNKRKVLRPTNAAKGPLPPAEHAHNVSQLLTDTRLEIGIKSKCIKYRRIHDHETEDFSNSAARANTNTTAKCSIKDAATNALTSPSTVPVMNSGHNAIKKRLLFADESTCESFFRRLSWTADGAFLVTPAALWHKDPTNMQSTPSFATFLFARHRFDEPYRVLSGLEKPSVVVRPNPVLFQLPPAETVESKENCPSQANVMRATSANTGSLPYRSVFAVLTLDSVIIYDTYHTKPLSIIRGLHYTNLTSCVWSKDGHELLLCSTDGYVSIISFDKGELGEPYQPIALSKQSTQTRVAAAAAAGSSSAGTPNAGSRQAKGGNSSEPFVQRTAINPTESAPLPPCEPGKATIQAPPMKKAKIEAIQTWLVARPKCPKRPLKTNASTTPASAVQTKTNATVPTVAVESSEDSVGASVQKLSLGSGTGMAQQPKKKKKRIQPVLA